MASASTPLEWSATAVREFLGSLAYIAEDSPQGAKLVKGRIDRALAFLAENPGMGQPGAVVGTREYAVPKTRHTLIYEVRKNGLYVLHCWHQSRRRETP